jgi:hypothetical protein
MTAPIFVERNTEEIKAAITNLIVGTSGDKPNTVVLLWTDHARQTNEQVIFDGQQPQFNGIEVLGLLRFAEMTVYKSIGAKEALVLQK